MATYQVLYWQEIPSLVEARDSDGVKKIQLSDKFQALIDEAAMRRDFAGTDAYIEEWNKGPKTEQDGSCLLYTSPSPRDQRGSRMPSSA